MVQKSFKASRLVKVKHLSEIRVYHCSLSCRPEIVLPYAGHLFLLIKFAVQYGVCLCMHYLISLLRYLKSAHASGKKFNLLICSGLELPAYISIEIDVFWLISCDNLRHTFDTIFSNVGFWLSKAHVSRNKRIIIFDMWTFSSEFEDYFLSVWDEWW